MRISFAIIFLFFLSVGISQKPVQNIRGVVKDNVTQIPLAYANVILNDSIVASTDEDGIFRFEDLHIGQYNMVIKYLGYSDRYLPNIKVNSGKETILNIEMEESTEAMEEVVVKANKERSKPINQMSLISTRMVSVEETQNYAASFDDPARMANSFAGVVDMDSGDNHIIIRGNAPNGLLWRMEGIEIPNPNHFSYVGTAGGGVSILSGQLLANSDFSTGAFAAEYGNALSGVFDIKLRKGNDEKREYTVKLGALGIDLAAEGPFKKGSNNSFLVNYRYSTLGIVSQTMDLGGFVTTFQDLSYNLSFKTKKHGQLTVFGLNGLSSQSGIDSIWGQDFSFVANTLVNGVTHSKTLSKRAFLRSGLVLSHTNNGVVVKENDELQDDKEYTAYDEGHKQNRLTFSSVLNYKLNPRISIKSGIILNGLDYQVQQFAKDSLNGLTTNLYDRAGNTATSQLYFQSLIKKSDRMTMNVGAHVLYNWLNDKSSFEPRFGFQYKTTRNQTLSLGYGLHSQVLPLATYFVQEENNELPNKNLGNSKAHHLVLGYSYKPSTNLNIKTEVYYQHLFNIPIGFDTDENYSLLNSTGGTPEIALNNGGRGKNYGVELSIERYLSKGFYLSLVNSLYESKFKAADQNWYNTRFNGNLTTTLTTGKEWQLKGPKNRTLGVHLKSAYAKGQRQNRVNLEESILKNETVYHTTNPFEDRVSDFFRSDLKVILKRNYSRMTSSFIIELQNVTSRENESEEVYNPQKQSIERGRQIGLLPIISYKIEF